MPLFFFKLTCHLPLQSTMLILLAHKKVTTNGELWGLINLKMFFLNPALKLGPSLVNTKHISTEF